MFRAFRALLAATVSISLITSVFAQSTTPASGPLEAPGSRSIEEVVVTAQKREEVLQNVPASISVLSGVQVENLSLNSLSDFATYVPGFAINSGGTPGLARLTLRGIQTGGGGAPLVGMYIDDAPVGSSRSPSSYILDLLPYDVQRIEVLRGPQGTLYGAGAMGGLVKYVLREADPHNFEARVGGTVESIANSDQPSWGSRGSINLPLVDGMLAVRASGYYYDDAGYIDNAGIGVRDENSGTRDGGRLALFFKPIDGLQITASALFQNIETDGRALVELNAATDQPVFNRYTHDTALPERFDQKLQFYSVTVNWDVGFATLTSSSSLSRTNNKSRFDYTPIYGRFCRVLSGGAVPPCLTDLPDSNQLDKYTEEVRLTSAADRKLSWMLGLFDTYEDGVNAQTLRALDASEVPVSSLNPLLDYYSPNFYREKAVFGNATYQITDRFDVMGGGRWANNSQVLHSRLVGPLIGPDQIIRAESEDSVFTWMVSPRFRFDRDTTLYGRIATGYRPGGPNSPLPEVPPQFNSDTTTNYEAGYKANWLNGALALDMAIFYINWKDIQISARNANGINYRANGGAASSRGVEFTTSYQVTDHWRVGATGSYTNAILNQDVASLRGRSGDRLPQSPHWTGSLTADYERRLGRWMLQFGGGYRYYGSSFSEVQSSPTTVEVPTQNIVDVYAGGTFDGRTSLRLYVRNLFNNRSYTNWDDTNTPGFPNFVPVQPRTIGASVDFTF
jgi:iron complex outermembrane recepter protein